MFEGLLEKALSRDQVASGFHGEGTTTRDAKDLIRERHDGFKFAEFTDAENKVNIETVRTRGCRLGVTTNGIRIEC